MAAMCMPVAREEADDVSSALSTELADSLVNIAMDQAFLGGKKVCRDKVIRSTQWGNQ